MINEFLEELNIQQGVRVLQHWNIPEIYTNSVGRHVTDNWISGENDHLVAAVRSSCKIHQCFEQGIEVTRHGEAFDLVKDELHLLDIDDVTYVYDMVKAIAD